MDERKGTKAYGTANRVEGESSVVPKQWAACPGVVSGAGDKYETVETRSLFSPHHSYGILEDQDTTLLSDISLSVMELVI